MEYIIQIRGARWEEVHSEEGEMGSEESAFGFCTGCRENGGEVAYVCRCVLCQDGEDNVWLVVERFDDALAGVLNTS